MNSPKNILILTPGFPANEQDTSCIPALQTLVQAMHREYDRRINIHVVTYQYPFENGEYFWNGISCWSAGGKNKPFPARWQTWLSVIRHARKIHRLHNIDVVHSFWLNECTLTGSWIAQITGATHIAHIMGRDVLPSNRYIKYFSGRETHIIANSPFTERKLFESFRIQADSVIPFGLDPHDFNGVSFSSDRKIDLLGVGSLTEIKNYSLFVDIFQMLAKDNPTIRGAIIGDGPQRSQLQEKIDEANLTDQLLLMGSMTREHVLREMSNSKILLHTAPYESAGYVFLEALYSGMHVVSYKTGFIPEVPEAIQCTDEHDMLHNLQSILNHPLTLQRVQVPLIADTAKEIVRLYGVSV